ncbi:pentapeptide repeat-containing protein [Microbulbifer sp. SSSA002]|uniref:pentapeptide repeat-containing protein n=1 Tax=Microbulbifer sp. SSSA002 TaxID=3243376 RepID=UPI00403990B1
MSMNFYGKWSFRQDSQYITLDTGSDNGQLDVSGTSEGDEQKFNAYGSDSGFILQGPNGKYVAWSGDHYQASLERDGELTYFSLETDGNDFRIVDRGIKGGGSTQYYLDNSSGKLTRVDKSGTPAATTVFSRTVVTVGLEQIQNEGFQSPKPDLRWVYLEDADLSSVIDFSNVNATDANLCGVNLSDVPMNSVTFTRALVKNAKMTGISADLSGSSLLQADFTGTDFTDATLIKVNFTGANLTGTNMTGTSLSQPDFTDANLKNARLSNPSAAGGSIDLMEMIFSEETNFTGTELRYNYLQNNDFTRLVFSHADLTGCKMDNCKLDRADFAYANLTATSLTGNISMVGTNFSNATLTDANMTGAQMGSIGLRFRVTDAAEFDTFKQALLDDNVDTVKTIFSDNGYPLSGTVSITDAAYAPGRIWEVQDSSGTYTVRLESVGGSNSLAVYQTVAAAILVNAFMRGTILTSANLFNVRASGVQLYGGAKLDGGAILEGAQFDNANLSGINLKQAQLYGVSFNYATLTDAEFQGAKLTQSASGGGASLLRANLQGANFSDTELNEAIFTDAAVSVSDLTDTSVRNGVWLFDSAQSASLSEELTNAQNSFTLPTELLPYLHQGKVTPQIQAGFSANGVTISDDAIVSVQQYGTYWQVTDGTSQYVIFQSVDGDQYQPALGVAEGTDDTKTPAFFMPLYLESLLGTGPVSAAIAAQFKQNGIDLSSDATVEAKQQETDWLLTDTSVSYNLWRGLNLYELALTARPAVPMLLSLFSLHSRPLTNRATVSSSQSGRWRVDNDSNNPFNPITNYIKFNLVNDKAGDTLNIYGDMFRVIRLSAQGETEYENVICGVTELPESVLQASTICPNSVRFDVNQHAGTDYNQWMRAKELPLSPYCVPSADGIYYCPQKPPSSPPVN